MGPSSSRCMSRYGEGNDPRRILHQGWRDRAQRRPQDRDDERDEYRRPADPGRLALPFLRDQPGAEVRPEESARHAIEHRGRHGGALRAGADARRDFGRARRQANDLRLPPGRDGKAVSRVAMAHDWTSIEIGLVLQGGGALGAYEWGAIEALFGLMDELEEGIPVTLKVVTGVSIGAINGACVVGVKGANGKQRRQSGRAQLEALWNDLQLETPFRGRFDLPFGLPSFAPARDMSLLGLPGFYTPRPDVWNFPKWTSLYDTSPLKATLNKHIVFPEIDASETGFVVSAVDVERGTLKRFRNASGRQQRVQRPEADDVVVPFKAEHVMASGSLAPQFPWTEIKQRL